MLILFSLKANITNTNSLINKNEMKVIPKLQLTNHGAIEIISNDNFTDYGFFGLGTELNPYLIENYNITISEGIGISISGTTDFFVIQNCYIDALDHGIFMNNVEDGTAKIINNTVSYNRRGIEIEYAPGITVFNNTCLYNDYLSIRLEFSPGSILANNTCGEIIYSGCTSVYASPGTIISNNTFFNGGLSIWELDLEDFQTYIVEDNWVNNKPLGYFIDQDNFIITDAIYGQIILINCSKIKIYNQLITKTYRAFFLDFCENITLADNTLTDINYRCIDLWYSSNISVFNNTGINRLGSSGFHQRSCLYSSIINNTFSGGYLGIETEIGPESSFTSSFSKIINNTVFDSYEGIYIANENNVTIVDNTCRDNRQNGIKLYYSSYQLIKDNLLKDNEGYGVFLNEGSHNNTIYHNSFINNLISSDSQANDLGKNNTWYNETLQEGNLWSNWPGFGVYEITGTADSVDLYPIDFIAPVFENPPDDLICYLGDTGKNITWFPKDWSPKNFSIYINGILNESSVWSGSNISISINCSIPGIFEYKCVVFDQRNNSAIDIVLVSVIEDYPPDVNNPDDVTFFEGEIGSNVTWIATDLDPDYYIVYIDGVVEFTDYWTSGVPIVISTIYLSQGTYNFTIIVFDALGNNISDTVFVTITPAISEFRFIENTLICITIVIVPLIIIIKRRKTKFT